MDKFYQDLRQIQKKERNNGTLARVEEDFYSQLQEYMDVLKQEDIPCIVRRTLGAGLATSVGGMLECYRFYVPFAELNRALAVVDELFPKDAGDDVPDVEG